ncbi:6-phosphofructokinase II [Enterobacillus tribolii]|uniref:Phosphofructokinase n=1 Tax=Enterobacillus tribolii TaxID=1487935 RepID=A0A370R3R4_9GAMM|nr:6-phosphofructokinase II [Enterobacillus tribolii]MBW7984333.1 6-phosphofructokinase II [Enterobacillus tribolii]RDK97070.1 6-phosphofructokinase 2 [Enterobacillus tribolii]
MTQIYTVTLSPSLDSATTTNKIYPEGKLRCTTPVFEPGGGGINVARAIVHLEGQATAIFPCGGATGEHLQALLVQEGVNIEAVTTQDWTRQNLHVHTESTGEQYRFVMPGAKLSAAELALIGERLAAIPSGSLLVISGSLPPGVDTGSLRDLLQQAQRQGLRCILDSSGDALAAGLEQGGLVLVKPNQNELAALTGKVLDQPDAVLLAARALVERGSVENVVVSLGPQGALAVNRHQWVQVVPPPVKKQSTVGAGDSMVGAMVMRLAQGADLLDMARYGVAAGSAATLNQGTCLCLKRDVESLYHYLCQQNVPLNHF